MINQPTFLQLPKLIFLMNGKPLESVALAGAICRAVPQGCIEFFQEPLSAGVVGLYYGDTPFDGHIAFDTPEEKCRHSNFSLSNRRASLRSWVEAQEGREILGRLARDRVERSYDLFSNFIFPDAEHGLEIIPLVRRFPHGSVLVLAPGLNVPGPLAEGPIDIVYATPQETLAKLSHRNEEESAA